MTPPELEIRVLLRDIIESADAVSAYVAGKSIDNFLHERQLRASVERELITIGEALGGVLKRDPSLAEKISDCRDIVDFRNVLVHGYGKVNPGAVWAMIETELPRLRTEVLSLLAG